MNSPDLSNLTIPDVSRVGAAAITLTGAAWVVLQLLKREIQALKKYLVRAVLLLALILISRLCSCRWPL